MICRKWNKDIYDNMKRLAKPEEVQHIVNVTGLSPKVVVETRCGLMCEAVMDLFGFTNGKRIDGIPNNPAKGYFIDLEGVKADGNLGVTDHEMMLFNDGISWYIADSYLGCRYITCRRVDINALYNSILRLSRRFTQEDWQSVAGCKGTLDTARVNYAIYEYDYRLP